MYLDQTLERTIKRFEDEYPESRPTLSAESQDLSYIDPALGTLSRLTSHEDGQDQPAEHEGHPEADSVGLARTSSNTSLAARALTEEEGRMHRFGQSMRREVLKPTGTDDVLHGTLANDPAESPTLAALRQKLEGFSGEIIRSEVESKGADKVIKELGLNAQELAALEKQDPEGFANLKNSQLAAQMNSTV